MSDQPTPNLNKALAAAWGELNDPVKGRTAKVRLKDNKGEYSYQYASIDDVLQSVRATLSKHGLAVTQVVDIDPTDKTVILISRLLHESGEEKVGRFPLSWDGGMQDHGGEITYARRYALEALIGVAASPDDDGAAAQESAKPKPKQTRDRSAGGAPEGAAARAATEGSSPPAEPAPASASELRPFYAKLHDLGIDWESLVKFTEAKGMGHPDTMTPGKREALLGRLGTTEGREAYNTWRVETGAR